MNDSNEFKKWKEKKKLFVLILKIAGEFFSNFSFKKTEDFHSWAFLSLQEFKSFTFPVLRIKD